MPLCSRPPHSHRDRRPRDAVKSARGHHLVMQQLPRAVRLGPFPPISTGENQSRTRVTEDTCSQQCPFLRLDVCRSRARSRSGTLTQTTSSHFEGNIASPRDASLELSPSHLERGNRRRPPSRHVRRRRPASAVSRTVPRPAPEMRDCLSFATPRLVVAPLPHQRGSQSNTLSRWTCVCCAGNVGR